MRIAVLGPDDEARARVEALLLSGGHVVVSSEAAPVPSMALLHVPAGIHLEAILHEVAALRSRLPLLALIEQSERSVIERLLHVVDAVLPWPVAGQILSAHLARMAHGPAIAAEARFRAAIDGSLDAVYFLDAVRDPAGRIVDFVMVDLNARAAGFLGKTREEIIGMRLLEINPSAGTSDRFSQYVRVVESGEIFERDLYLDPPAKPGWYHMQAIKVGDGISIAARNITERVRDDQRLRRKQALLDQAAHLAHLGCWSYDPISDRVEGTDELYRLLGVARDDVPPTAAGHLAMVHPDDRQTLAAQIAEAAARPRRIDIELRIVRADGAVRHCQLVADLEPGPHTGPAPWLGTMQDDTERVTADKLRAANESQLHRLFAKMPIAFSGRDEHGIIRMWNDETERITGYRREEIVGNPHADELLLVDEQQRARLRELLARPPGQSRDERLIMRRKDGEQRIVAWWSLPAEINLAGVARASMGIDVTDAERAAQRYRTLAHHLPNGAVLLYDRELRYLLADGAALAEAGLDAAQLLGKTVETADPENAAQLVPLFRAALEGHTGRCEVGYAGRDYEVTCVPVYDASGRIEAGMVLTQDITARKRAEAALREERERLSSVLGLIPALVVGVDPDGRTTFVNPAAELTTGYTAEELIGRNWWDTLDLAEDQRQLADLQERGFLRSYEMVLRSKGGERRTVSWSAGGTLVRHGQTTETFLYGLDVTERNQMQERLVIAERMVSVGTLAAGLAHEINNPLSYVIANLSMAGDSVVRGESSEELVELLSDARQGAERIAKIVGDLRIFSRSDEGRSELINPQHSLEACLHITANELRHRTRVERSYRPVPLIYANEARLGQVFLNLIMNAVHALPEGRARENLLRVSTDIDPRGQVVVEIADNGVGIAPAVLRHIFDPFFTTKPVGVGTGLGLAIAHRIVTGFGGDITVESEEGRGSLFRVALPAAESSVESEPVERIEVPAPRRGRVLVVDDDARVGTVIRRALEKAHAVTVVTSAEQAFATLAAAPPFDVIVCDLMLPEVSGMDIYRRLLTEAPDQAQRMIFITGGAFTARARAFLDEVPNPIVSKPFAPAALLSLVNEQLAAWGPV